MAAGIVLKVFLLTSSRELRDQLPFDLAGFDIDVWSHGNAADMYRQLEQEPCDICLIDAAPSGEDVLSVVARLRAFSAVGIVMLTTPDQVEERIRSLWIGADAYMVMPLDVRELAAVMLGLARRLRAQPVLQAGSTLAVPPPLAAAPPRMAEPAQSVSAPEPTPQRWSLEDTGWTLAAPSGGRLALTPAERSLLSALLEKPGVPLSREAISIVLSGGAYQRPGKGRANEYSSHRIDMLVSRLRRKARRAGINLPLNAVRGYGYEFFEPQGGAVSMLPNENNEAIEPLFSASDEACAA